MLDFNEMLWGSFWIQTKNKTLYFAGDTAYAPHFKKIAKLMNCSPDTVIMPIGAYKPPFMMQNAHINPQEAAKACTELGGQLCLPMHYGTYDLADEPLGEPIRWFKKEMDKQGLQDTLQTPAVGEVIYL